MIHTQEVAQVAVAFLLCVICGVGTFLMDVRAGRQTGNLLGLVTEIFVAVTAGVIAYLWGRHKGWDLFVTYLAVTIASNNGHEVVSGMKRINIDMILNGIMNLIKKGGSK
ncbi:holin [Salmonella enterica subsp. salamae]|nr:holin [Salmonella enterica subsp. salamae]ECW0044455.1 holin [Salmonella enterica]